MLFCVIYSSRLVSAVRFIQIFLDNILTVYNKMFWKMLPVHLKTLTGPALKNGIVSILLDTIFLFPFQIDLRFTSINNTDFHIKIKLAGFYVAKVNCIYHKQYQMLFWLLCLYYISLNQTCLCKTLSMLWKWNKTVFLFCPSLYSSLTIQNC